MCSGIDNDTSVTARPNHHHHQAQTGVRVSFCVTVRSSGPCGPLGSADLSVSPGVGLPVIGGSV